MKRLCLSILMLKMDTYCHEQNIYVGCFIYKTQYNLPLSTTSTPKQPFILLQNVSGACLNSETLFSLYSPWFCNPRQRLEIVVVTEGCGEQGVVRESKSVLELDFLLIYPFPPKQTILIHHKPSLARSKVTLFPTNLNVFRVSNLFCLFLKFIYLCLNVVILLLFF